MAPVDVENMPEGFFLFSETLEETIERIRDWGRMDPEPSAKEFYQRLMGHVSEWYVTNGPEPIPVKLVETELIVDQMKQAEQAMVIRDINQQLAQLRTDHFAEVRKLDLQYRDFSTPGQQEQDLAARRDEIDKKLKRPRLFKGTLEREREEAIADIGEMIEMRQAPKQAAYRELKRAYNQQVSELENRKERAEHYLAGGNIEQELSEMTLAEVDLDKPSHTILSDLEGFNLLPLNASPDAAIYEVMMPSFSLDSDDQFALQSEDISFRNELGELSATTYPNESFRLSDDDPLSF